MAWIGLACLLALSVLAACGDSREPTPTSTPTAEVPTPAPIATPEPEPTATPEPEPAATPEPEPTATPKPEPAATPEPEPAATPEPEPTATPETEPAATPEPEPTATPEPEPTATPEPEPTPTEEDTGTTAQPGFEIDSDTMWGDLFAVFDETEQSCIRDELGGDFGLCPEAACDVCGGESRGGVDIWLPLSGDGNPLIPNRLDAADEGTG